MALTQINLYNQAFFHLGLSRATSTTEDSKSVRAANEMYEVVRNELLALHNWNFATKRAVLAQDTTDPAYGYSYRYLLPSDFVRIVRLHDKGITYRIENGYLLSNESTIKLQYIAQVTDPSLFDPLFGQCLGLLLAWRISQHLVQNADDIRSRLRQEFDQALKTAKKVDSQQGTPERMEIWGLDNDAVSPGFSLFDGEIE